jgi:hypothetical protein
MTGSGDRWIDRVVERLPLWLREMFAGREGCRTPESLAASDAEHRREGGRDSL